MQLSDKARSRLVVLFAFACGAIVANLYYAQPLIGPIVASTGMLPETAGLVVTLTQIGYGLGLIFLVPLGDLVDTRRLVVTLICLVTAGLLVIATSQAAGIFLAASFFVGIACVAVQVLVPYSARLATEQEQGRVIGQVMSGLLFGILLARPIASFLAGFFGWHAIFWCSAVVMLILLVPLWRFIPAEAGHSRPVGTDGSAWARYRALMATLWPLLRSTPVLRRRAIYQAGMFGAFSLFWTAVPLLLAGPLYGFSQHGIAAFALAGASGALVTPWVGRLADRGWTRAMSAGALIIGVVSFAIAAGGLLGGAAGVALLVLAAALLDVGVSTSLVCGQRAIYALSSASRARLNGLFMALFFVGGALGSAVAGWAWARNGWLLTLALGAIFVLLPLVYFVFREPPDGPAR